MLRSKFTTAALLAATALLAAPAASQASFAVTITIDGTDYNVGYSSGGDFYTGGSTTIGTNTFINGTFLINGISGSFSGQTNQPGGATGFVLDTTTFLHSDAVGSHHVVVSALAQPFTQPGQNGDTLTLINGITSITGTLGGTLISDPNTTPGLSIFGRVDPDNNPMTNNSVSTSSNQYAPGPFAGWWSPTVTFTRGAAYSLATIIDLQMVNADTVQFTTQAIVGAPVPAGFVLVASALPFVAVLRRRLRKSDAVTAA